MERELLEKDRQLQDVLIRQQEVNKNIPFVTSRFSSKRKQTLLFLVGSSPAATQLKRFRNETRKWKATKSQFFIHQNIPWMFQIPPNSSILREVFLCRSGIDCSGCWTTPSRTCRRVAITSRSWKRRNETRSDNAQCECEKTVIFVCLCTDMLVFAFSTSVLNYSHGSKIFLSVFCCCCILPFFVCIG